MFTHEANTASSSSGLAPATPRMRIAENTRWWRSNWWRNSSAGCPHGLRSGRERMSQR